MNAYRLFYLVLFLSFWGCKKEQKNVIANQQTKVALDSLSKHKVDLNLLGLSPEATEDLKSFEDFQNLKSLVKSMHRSNPYYIQKYADSVNVLIQTLDEDLTEDFNKKTITSRLMVLATASGLLNYVANKKHPEPSKLLEANKHLITAYNSLVIQLNELSLAIPDNIEKELLKDLEEDLRDTIGAPPIEIEE